MISELRRSQIADGAEDVSEMQLTALIAFGANRWQLQITNSAIDRF